MRDKPITELYQDKLFLSMCKKYGKENSEELRSEVISILLEMPGDKLNHIIENGYLLPYTLQIVRFQSIDEKSKFNSQFIIYETIDNIEIPFDPIETQTELMESELRQLKAEITLKKIESDSLDQSNKYFYQANIAKSKPKYGSIRALSRKVGIDYRGMQIALNQYIEYLKEWQKK